YNWIKTAPQSGPARRGKHCALSGYTHIYYTEVFKTNLSKQPHMNVKRFVTIKRLLIINKLAT
ncbi:hypothetical protein, partial [Escherichia coli]|uniref:hypothetical protein n=1 Tax=Escherichia coli TaxID=562 RepID=UPI001BDD6116